MTMQWMATLIVSGAMLAQGASRPAQADKPLVERVRHELAMLPYVTIFDDLGFRIEDGDTVVLSGSVRRPILKSDAENVVKRLTGVESVRNEIRVLPLSPFDDRIRWAAARAIYASNALGRYALSPLPSVRILVENGNITLSGLVANEFDRNLAYMRAMGVSGAFSVTNNLQLEPRS